MLYLYILPLVLCGPVMGKNYKTTSGKKASLTIQCLVRPGCSHIYLTFKKGKVQYQTHFPSPYPHVVVIEKFCVTVQFYNRTERQLRLLGQQCSSEYILGLIQCTKPNCVWKDFLKSFFFFLLYSWDPYRTERRSSYLDKGEKIFQREKWYQYIKRENSFFQELTEETKKERFCDERRATRNSAGNA